MISIENYILLTIISPLLVSILTPFLSNNVFLRDLIGPLGGIFSSWGAIEIARSVLNGTQPSIEFFKLLKV